MFKQDYERQHKADIEKIKSLELEVKTLKNELFILRNKYEHVHKLKNEQQQKLSEFKNNERVAGRKKKLTDEVINDVHKYVNEGKTQREIAKIMGLSIGLINKACNFVPKS